MRVTILLLLAFGLSLGALGCGGGAGGVTAEGKVVKAGKPYTLGEGEGISINLHGEDNKANASGTVEKDGTFKLKGPEGGKVPPGKYKVAYTHYLPAKEKGTSPPTNKSTNEVWDLTSDRKDLVLDIGAAGKK